MSKLEDGMDAAFRVADIEMAQLREALAARDACIAEAKRELTLTFTTDEHVQRAFDMLSRAARTVAEASL